MTPRHARPAYGGHTPTAKIDSGSCAVHRDDFGRGRGDGRAGGRARSVDRSAGFSLDGSGDSGVRRFGRGAAHGVAAFRDAPPSKCGDGGGFVFRAPSGFCGPTVPVARCTLMYLKITCKETAKSFYGFDHGKSRRPRHRYRDRSFATLFVKLTIIPQRLRVAQKKEKR